MANIFTVKSPLAIRFRDGSKKILIELFPREDGAVGFELGWEQSKTPDPYIQVIEGDLKGEGPWKIGDAVLTVLGCHGTDAELASEYADWQFQREFGTPYPDEDVVQSIAKKFGATI
jgi:hypothetical protein